DIVLLQPVGSEEPPSFRVGLDQGYPNPFRGSSTIAFSLDHPQFVRLTLHDSLGRVVRVLTVGLRAPGTHMVLLPAGGLPSGCYVYRLATPAARVD
ncbi:T9SS type A sorting domain-containing protein, partial [Rhodothermus sp. AH-315-K08]|nr:T9SS type A sorting domain-containing protein [Rhodothermus sp. AH-315-K08]